jgi:hypothetical protein
MLVKTITTNPTTTALPTLNPSFLGPFSHPSEHSEFSQRIRPHMRIPEYRQLERDMEDAGLDPAVDWPKGVLEWMWSHAGSGRYAEIRRVARGCVREAGTYGSGGRGW